MIWLFFALACLCTAIAYACCIAGGAADDRAREWPDHLIETDGDVAYLRMLFTPKPGVEALDQLSSDLTDRSNAGEVNIIHKGCNK